MQLIIVHIILLGFTISLRAAEAGSSNQNSTSRADIESLIDISQYKDLLFMYENGVNFYIQSKTKAPECSKNPNCIAYWEKIKLDLMADNARVVANTKTKMIDLLEKRYSPAQVKWLLQNLKAPLYKDFVNFYNSNNSPLPFQDARLDLEAKKKNIRPFGSDPTQPAVPPPASSNKK